MFAAAILALASVVAVHSAVLSARQDNSGACSFSDASSFTLAAWATDGSAANSTGVPLVLGDAGAVTGAEFKVLATYASFPYNDWPTMTLSGGALTANFRTQGGSPALGNDVSAGGWPSFVVSNDAGPAASSVYCGIDSSDGNLPELAVHGDADSFSLCPFQENQMIVVYKATDDTSHGVQSYSYDQCMPVKVHIVEA